MIITSLASPAFNRPGPQPDGNAAVAVPNPYESVVLCQPPAAAPAPAPLGVIRSNVRFCGAAAGTAIGIGVAAASGFSGGSLFCGSLIGAWSGRLVGNILRNRETVNWDRRLEGRAIVPRDLTLLPPALLTFRKNAPTIGAVAGIGVGLALAFSGAGGASGSAILTNSIFGALGGLLTGRIIRNS